MGRPTKYKEEYADQAEKLCGLLGATDAKLAQFFDVCEDTINEWKKVHPKFSESIKSKSDADAEVEKSLFKTAKEGNTTAQIFWLKNRKPKEWRDKQDLDVTSKGESITGITRRVIDGTGNSDS